MQQYSNGSTTARSSKNPYRIAENTDVLETIFLIFNTSKKKTLSVQEESYLKNQKKKKGDKNHQKSTDGNNTGDESQKKTQMAINP